MAVPRSAVAFQSRAFGASAIRSLKESDRRKSCYPFHLPNTMTRKLITIFLDDPEQASNNEKHKQDSLAKSKDGKGHWKPELASDSEEAITADRNAHADHSADGIKELQKKTAEHAEKKHK